MFDPNETEMWHSWILAFEVDRSDIIAADKFQLIDQGRTCAFTGKQTEAQALFMQAREWAMHTRVPDARRVQAEANLYLGDLLRLLNDGTCQTQYEQARFLFEALSQHNLGVVSHRLATWHEENSRFAEAWREYNFVMTLWRELAREAGRLGNKRRYQKYQNQIMQIESQINSIVTSASTNTVANPAMDASKVADETGLKNKPHTSTRSRNHKETRVLVFPIYANLAAGSGLWLSENDDQDFAELDHLLIERKHYNWVNLLERSANISISSGFQYGISKIEGTSMNLAGIDNEDYVLYRKLRDLPYVPTNGDIVVASVARDGGRFGTVKRYCEEPSSHSLVPHSTEYHDSIPFDSNEIDVIGQVIAVLKLVEQ